MGASLIQAPIDPPEINYGRGDDWQKIEKAYVADLATWARQNFPSEDLVGEVIRWQRADGYAQYMVLSERPLRLMHLDLGDGYEVEGALLRGLTLTEVGRMVDFDRSWKHLTVDANEGFYGGLKVGDIVHYDNSFNQYIRCEVVAAPGWKSRLGSEGVAGIALKPIALIGPIRHQEPDGTWVHGWSDYDIVRRMPDGRIDHGYHAKMILDGELFQPHAGSIVENPTYAKGAQPGRVDPRGMEPISLDPPAVTDAEQRIVPLALAINKIREATGDILARGGYTEDVLRAVLTDCLDAVLEARTGRKVSA